jgi:small subunit ribosomal protein S17
MSETTPAAVERAARKERRGVVVSDAADKTIVVQVDRRTTHRMYGKTVTRSKKCSSERSSEEDQ